jgi:hypothetical protein
MTKEQDDPKNDNDDGQSSGGKKINCRRRRALKEIRCY